MKSRVYFAKLRQDGYQPGLVAALTDSCAIDEIISRDDLAAVKLTFGEEGNRGFINPGYVKDIVREIKKLKAKPFITDTNTLYRGLRMNAQEHLTLALKHGFDPSFTGAPLIIADGLTGADYVEVPIKAKHFKSVKIASAIAHSDALISMAHVTGHMVSGIGANLKNIAMGSASRAGKLMQHFGLPPEIRQSKCIGCGECAKHCPTGAITLKNICEENSRAAANMDEKTCIGCGECIVVCKKGAISMRWKDDSRLLQERMAEYALGVIKQKKNKAIYMNFANHITANCDCMATDEPVIVDNVGMLSSLDPVALDKASIDLIIERSGEDVFRKAFPECDWTIQLECAAELGLGRLEYELVEI